MKILFVIHDFWPKHRAGTENATYFLARELAKRHEVTVFTIEQETIQLGFHEIYRVDNFRVIKIHYKKPIPKSFRETYLDEALDKIFEKYINEIDPDIIHFQHLISLSLNFIKIAKSKRKLILFTAHDFWFRCPLIRGYSNKENCDPSDIRKCNKCIDVNIVFEDQEARKYKNNFWVKKILEISKKRYRKRFFYILLDNFRLRKYLYEKNSINLTFQRKKDFLAYFNDINCFITPSNFLSRELEKFGIKKEKIITLPHGIPIPDKYPENNREKEIDDEINFYFISHITQDKGFLMLLDNFFKLSGKFDNVRLRIYGAYSRNNRMILKAIKRIDYIENVDYFGVFDNKNIEKIISEADVIVIPSLWQEIYGLVLDEAFLYGIPVIVSNRGALPERVQDGINGFVFDPEKKQDLFKKMSIIAENPLIINEMRKNIPKMKSIKIYAKEIESLYSGLVQNH